MQGLLSFLYLTNAVLQVNDPPVRNSQEAFMMEMRSARMVRVLFLFILMLISKNSYKDILFYLNFIHQSLITLERNLLVIDCVWEHWKYYILQLPRI